MRFLLAALLAAHHHGSARPPILRARAAERALFEKVVETTVAGRTAEFKKLTALLPPNSRRRDQ